jgi:1,4-alpha-glucan branching enzyme
MIVLDRKRGTRMNVMHRRFRSLPFGDELFSDRVRFRYWAPARSRGSVMIDGQTYVDDASQADRGTSA